MGDYRLAGLVEEIVNLARGLVVDARHLRKIVERGALDGFQRAEMMQQRAFARRADAGNFLQARFADVLLPARAVRADGEAVRLVAQPLNEIEQRIARRQLHRRLSGQIEGLVAGVAVRPLGDADHRHVGHAERGQGLARGIELACPPSISTRSGQGEFAFASSSLSRRRDARACAVAASAAAGSARGASVDQPLEPALQHLAHHAEVVAGRELGGADVELAILVLLEALRARDDHGADRVRALDVAVVVDLDAARHARQPERFGQRLEQLLLRRGVGQLAPQRLARIDQRVRRPVLSSRRAAAPKPRPCGRSWRSAPPPAARAPGCRATAG